MSPAKALVSWRTEAVEEGTGRKLRECVTEFLVLSLSFMGCVRICGCTALNRDCVVVWFSPQFRVLINY